MTNFTIPERFTAESLESHYQSLVKEKMRVSTLDDGELVTLVEQFSEIAGYKDASILQKECFDLALKRQYDSLVGQKKYLDSEKESMKSQANKTFSEWGPPPATTPLQKVAAAKCAEAWRALARNYRLIAGGFMGMATRGYYADTAKLLADECDKSASECDNQVQIFEKYC